MGKAPQLITVEGRVITESNAIAKYLIDTYDKEGKFKGDDKNDALRDEELTSFSATNLNANAMVVVIFRAMALRSPFFARFIINNIQNGLSKGFMNAELTAQFQFLNDQLGEQDYFMGKAPGRADFMMSWPIDELEAQNMITFDAFPKLKAWHQRCKARDGWKRSIEKGNGYKLSM